MKKVIFAVMVICCMSANVLAVRIDFGGEYTIDYVISDSVHVHYSPTPDFLQTTVNIVDGAYMTSLYVANNSIVNISGGEIWGSIYGTDSSQIYIMGGNIGTSGSGDIVVDRTCSVTIQGTNFNYPLGNLPTKGHLTGILSTGDQIDRNFQVEASASIELVPEPATILMLAFGTIILRNRHRR